MKPAGKHPPMLVSPALGLAAEGLPGHLCVRSLEVKPSFDQPRQQSWVVGNDRGGPVASPGCHQDQPPMGIPLAAVAEVAQLSSELLFLVLRKSFNQKLLFHTKSTSHSQVINF